MTALTVPERDGVTAFSTACHDDMVRALTPRQYAVMRLRALGWTYSEVATKLGITDNTVRCHSLQARVRMGCVMNVDLYRALGWLVVPS